MTFSCYVRAFEHPHHYHAPPDPNQRPIKFIYMKVIKFIWFLPHQLFGIFGCFFILFFIFILFFMSTEHEFLISAFKTANFRIKIASTDIEWGLGLTKTFYCRTLYLKTQIDFPCSCVIWYSHWTSMTVFKNSPLFWSCMSFCVVF